MTIKEIAELCRVSDQTVLNWIHRLESLNQKIWLRLSEKLKQGSPEHPSDYDLGETLEIISEGGNNKTLASLLAENAIAKTALVTRREPSADTERFEKAFAAIVKLQNRLETEIKEVRRLRGAIENKRIEDPQEKQYAAIREFLIANLNITGRNRDFVYLPDLWRRFNEIMVSPRMDMNALLFAIDKIGLNGIRVVTKGGFKGLHGCRLITTDW
jgi:hypothetical protein